MDLCRVFFVNEMFLLVDIILFHDVKAEKKQWMRVSRVNLGFTTDGRIMSYEIFTTRLNLLQAMRNLKSFCNG